MAIEINPRVQPKQFLVPIIALMIALILGSGIGASYIFFHQSIEKMREDIKSKEQQLIKTTSEKELESKLSLYEAKINSFGQLFNDHKKPINVFLFLEDVTHPDVYFTDFDFDSSTGAMTLTGKSETFTALEQQLIILKQSELLNKINLSEIAMAEEGGVDFGLQLSFNSQVLK
tara:strand:+ start:202 stop:723 length:522 start_codon:yes stop_codon:yes gene_type:complete